MDFTYFIGVDVSKSELDFAVLKGKAFVFHEEIENKPEAVKAFIKKLLQLPDFNLAQAVFCMEHTGIYNNHILGYLHKKKSNICLEAASQIRSSIGNIRGKNDKVDSVRIAEYAYKNRDDLHLWQPKREVIEMLAHLATTRSRLLSAQKMLKTPLRESKSFVKKKFTTESARICNRTLNSIKADLDKIQAAIDEVIASDPELSRLFRLITSVKGIGKVTATQMIVTTNEFKDITDPKKFACYCGVAPFTHESGKFKGKARVSHMANKKVKTLLHLSALTAIQWNDDIRVYYERKLSENKNKMSILNAVRNKLILRVFSCVNQNRKYEKNYIRSIA